MMPHGKASLTLQVNQGGEPMRAERLIMSNYLCVAPVPQA